ncbi:MAG: RDD family protein [Simkaniaceae bacterium]|nr:RDD family protein [Simkaniaceae bacterium]
MWYYKVGDEKTGPVSHRELQDKLESGEILSSTKIWTEEFTDWLPISEVEHFNMTTLDETPTITIEKKVAYSRETDEDDRRPRPWVRFWARMIDYSLFIFVIYFIARYFGLILGFLDSFSEMIAIFLWTFVEAFLLATWGATPGKWMLKVMVRDENHQKLSFSEGMNRSLSVWWLGMGTGLSIISWITMIVAAIKLESTGVTTWDRRGGNKVFHGNIGVVRGIIVLLYFLCYVGMIVWGQMQMIHRAL